MVTPQQWRSTVQQAILKVSTISPQTSIHWNPLNNEHATPPYNAPWVCYSTFATLLGYTNVLCPDLRKHACLVHMRGWGQGTTALYSKRAHNSI